MPHGIKRYAIFFMKPWIWSVLVPSIPEHRQTDLKKLGLNDRQIEALRLMVNEKVVFSNKKYREHFKVSNQTFVRDMKILFENELVVAEGTRRALKYSGK